MEALKRKLEYHYKKFDQSEIYPDPIIFPRRFESESDIEISAFISSIFAYGNVTQIMNSLDLMHDLIGDNPTEFFQNFKKNKYNRFFNKFKHRFYTGEDVRMLFMIIQYILKNYESIKHLFLLYHFDHERNLKNSISSFSQNLNEISKRIGNNTRGVTFMFPDPFKGSACKRMNLFLRWMVRKDEIDFGIWKAIRKNELIIPVDTHIARICKELGLTKRNNVSWQMAEEITDNLIKMIL